MTSFRGMTNSPAGIDKRLGGEHNTGGFGHSGPAHELQIQMPNIRIFATSTRTRLRASPARAMDRGGCGSTVFRVIQKRIIA